MGPDNWIEKDGAGNVNVGVGRMQYKNGNLLLL